MGSKKGNAEKGKKEKEEKKKRKWGDRRDGRWVKDAPGMQQIMAHLMPNRTDNEVYLHDSIDATELMRYLEEKNVPDAPYQTTIFHCAVTALTRMVMERPLMNRFVQGRRIYERDEVSLSFVCRRRFTDHAEEALMTLVPKKTDTLSDISQKIVGDVIETRKSETATGGIDETLNTFAKLPRPILMLLVRIVRWLDFWGKNLRVFTDGDPDYSTILVSNLGSIHCPAVYHHLNNYGTTSIMITIGTLHKEEVLMDDGSKKIRDMIDIGATLDERIADGFYFARSLKLIKYIFAHPEILDWPLDQPSGCDYT